MVVAVMFVLVPVVFVFMEVLMVMLMTMVVLVFHFSVFLVLFDLVFQFAKLLTFQNTALSPIVVKASRHHRGLPMVPDAGCCCISA